MRRGGEVVAKIARGLAFELALVAWVTLFTACIGRNYLSVLVNLTAALVSAVAVGAFRAAVVSRLPECRSLHLVWGDLVLRGARNATITGVLYFWVSASRSSVTEALLLGTLIGTMIGLLAIVRRPVVTRAERAYGRALICLRRGDRAGAGQAIEYYVKHAGDDPSRETRLPVAERFLRGEVGSLDVFATELEAASAPAGRGTEVTAAQRPAGTGTELLSVPQASAAEVPDRAAVKHEP